MPLILERKVTESFSIGSDIAIIVNKIEFPKVWLAIDAPRHLPISRDDAKVDHSRRALLALNESQCRELAASLADKYGNIPKDSGDLFSSIKYMISEFHSHNGG